ncbi:Dynein regulatory complex subunit 2 [Acropora cervicornis]|uniref:Dynein regulatory complex subunit 2 n=1 Tax=Acropora cervicornis TaxID=6130 RepID=A0AAD9Q854_ACRCE|nr:Dynein regulatory complex subunit 2 [Acropora cervicornis]
MAPKKKKSGKKKLAKMTEEERLLYLEQKRLAEEEMKKKKEDMLTQFLKDKLLKEEKSAKFNLNKLQNQWRVIMREAKSQELKKDIEILSQTFERVIDRKEAIIKSLFFQSKTMAPKKKKSGKKKLAKMTEEERLLYLEQKRLAEEEMKKKKEDMLTQFLKDKLLKEEKSAKFNLNKLQNQWRVIMREAKSQELKKDIEILSQTFERVIDRKEAIIKSLRRLQDSQDEYDQEQEILKDEFDTERMKIVNQQRREMHDVQDIMFAMEEEWNELENDAKQDFQSLRDEIKNKALKNYNETTEERKLAFENLKAKDEKSSYEIETQMRKLQRIQDNISQLKAKMASNAKECDERNRLIKEQREVVATQFHELKAEMNKMRDLESCSRGERILKVAEMCRKLETETEKVLPFYASSLTPEEDEDILHEYSALENFWKRYNKVLLDKLALDKEKHTLLQENQQLRAVLKQYLDGISVNDEILSQYNPLFIVNSKTNVRLAVPVTDPRVKRSGPTVVEAAHVVKHSI